MSAVVYCGKRSSSIFADDLLPPSPSPSKRSRFSPPPPRRDALLQHLRAFFPDMDPQLLERALEASGDDLDSAIKSLKELHLESTQAILPTGCTSENGQPTAAQQLSVEAILSLNDAIYLEILQAAFTPFIFPQGYVWSNYVIWSMHAPARRKPCRLKSIMAAGRRKRGAAAFLEEDPLAALPQLSTKRGWCAPLADVADLGVSMEFDPVDALQLIFPGADPQLLRGYFEASGNVLDAAIRGFKDYLASGSEKKTSADVGSSGGTSDGPELNTPTNSGEWAELIVKEMSSASDLIDAKNRAFRILELFDKSTANCNTPDEGQKMREEHKILKQMLGGLLQQNGILKRAFLIQHNRLKDYQEMVQERSQFKEIVDRYQEQIETLEMHLKQAQQSNSMPGRYSPDVF